MRLATRTWNFRSVVKSAIQSNIRPVMRNFFNLTSKSIPLDHVECLFKVDEDSSFIMLMSDEVLESDDVVVPFIFFAMFQTALSRLWLVSRSQKFWQYSRAADRMTRWAIELRGLYSISMQSLMFFVRFILRLAWFRFLIASLMSSFKYGRCFWRLETVPWKTAVRCRYDDIDDLAVQLVDVVVCDISCDDLVVDALAKDIPVGLGGFPHRCSSLIRM